MNEIFVCLLAHFINNSYLLITLRKVSAHSLKYFLRIQNIEKIIDRDNTVESNIIQLNQIYYPRLF